MEDEFSGKIYMTTLSTIWIHAWIYISAGKFYLDGNSVPEDCFYLKIADLFPVARGKPVYHPSD